MHRGVVQLSSAIEMSHRALETTTIVRIGCPDIVLGDDPHPRIPGHVGKTLHLLCRLKSRRELRARDVESYNSGDRTKESRVFAEAAEQLPDSRVHTIELRSGEASHALDR